MDITAINAYRAMVFFLEQYYERTKSDDIGSLLGDMMLLNNGTTADPAVWNEWLRCLQRANLKE
jgi:hypothetical protein